MRRSPAAIQQWPQLRPNSSSINSATLVTRRNNTIAATPATPRSRPTNRNNPPSSARPFHSSQCLQAMRRAAPAPATKQRLLDIKEGRTASGMPLWLNRDGIFLDSMWNWRDDIDEWMDERRRLLSKQYERAYYDGYLPKGVRRSVFARVAGELAKAAAHDRPAANLIKKISGDVNTIFHIGYCISTDDQRFRQWIVSACALAGARLPVALIVVQTLHQNKMPSPEWVGKLQDFSRGGYPPAMLLRAKIHVQRNEFEQAFALLENQILPHIEPSNRRPIFFQDMVLGGLLESPWRIYAVLHEKQGILRKSKENRKKADDALRRAAMEYHDVEALLDCATVAMVEGDLDLYEECMLKAATTGKLEACIFIANFYLLVSQGVYPTRGERKKPLNKASVESTPEEKPTPEEPTAAKPTPAKEVLSVLNTRFTKACDWVRSCFQQSMDRKDYAKLAEDWYYLVYMHRHPKGAMMMALLKHEMGDKKDGSTFLRQFFEWEDENNSKMMEDPKTAERLRTWVMNWNKDGWEPTISRKDLPVK